jgi:hypothetical protein
MSGPKYCLHCLERVDKFMRSATGGPSLPQCPKCQGYIPAIYDDQYDRYPPLFMTMIGQRAHGKTAYLASLLQQLHRVGREWHNFAFMPLDDRVLMSLDTYLEQLQSGQAFERTEAEAKEAIGVRLSGIPHLGNRHLLIYDVGGEVFDSTVDIQNTRGSTWFRNPVVVWFVSLTNLNEREYARDYELTGMLTRFAQALTEMGKSPTTKTILIVLTKADLLRTWPNMPQSINDLLDGQEDYTGPDCWARLERISRDAEQWLRQSGLHNFVNSLRQTFGAVQYCITSAFGVAPDDNGQRAFGAEPRGVLAPLFWLYRFYHGAKIRSGHATYYSLVDAIANNRGEPIVLREGIYEINEPLRIDRPLTIQGQGRDESWLMAKCPGPLITYTGRGPVRDVRRDAYQRAGTHLRPVQRSEWRSRLERLHLLRGVCAPDAQGTRSRRRGGAAALGQGRSHHSPMHHQGEPVARHRATAPSAGGRSASAKSRTMSASACYAGMKSAAACEPTASLTMARRGFG